MEMELQQKWGTYQASRSKILFEEGIRIEVASISVVTHDHFQETPEGMRLTETSVPLCAGVPFVAGANSCDVAVTNRLLGARPPANATL